ncbi:hypothetical protein D3C74_386290 [compost metagenome]
MNMMLGLFQLAQNRGEGLLTIRQYARLSCHGEWSASNTLGHLQQTLLPGSKFRQIARKHFTASVNQLIPFAVLLCLFIKFTAFKIVLAE